MRTSRKQKKSDSSSRLALEEVIGLTTKNANGLASNIRSPKCVYVAGCVVVVYNVDSCTQSHFMVSHRMPKPLSCVAVSRDGRFVAAGESGHQPAVLVWDYTSLTFVSELKGHLYGVECIAFSHDGEYLVSVGGYIYLWDLRSGTMVTKLKASSSCSVVTSVSFSSDGKFIVTAGKKHLKFWKVGSSPRTWTKKGTQSLAIHAKHVDLGLQKGSSFVSVLSSIRTNISISNSEQAGELFQIYALTDAGVLCLINSGLSVRKAVDLKVEKGFALSASEKLIACACSNGVVQLFNVNTLEYTGSILYSEAKKGHEKSDIVYPVNGSKDKFQLGPTRPDAVACQFSTAEKLVVVYGDHSLYVWDIHDVNQATRCCALISHSACIWDIKNLCCENRHDPSLACVARGCSGGVSFATCSADGTIRLWDFALQPDSSKITIDYYGLNNESVRTAHLVSAGIFERDTMETSVSTLGFRSLAVSQDGKYLAAGDIEGNLHIYDLHTSDYICLKDAHDAEILSLSFSLSSVKAADFEGVMDGHYFLASGGRDRLIHLYDTQRNFDLIGSVDDHSAAVTSVKVACNGCKILSCSADRSLVFRDVALNDGSFKISRSHHQMASHGTVYDMAVDPKMEIVVTVGQDKKINTFNVATGRLIRSFKQDKDFGDPIKVIVDPSCSYLVCSYSNKCICIFDLISGELVTQAVGQGEVVTGVIFLPDCKHIVSVGGDGCIFVWKVPPHLASRMLQRVTEGSGTLSPTDLVQPAAFSRIIFCEEEDEPKDVLSPENVNRVGKNVHYEGKSSNVNSGFKFSISRLPKWAQAKVTSFNAVSINPECMSTQKLQQELKIFSPCVDDAGPYALVCPEIQTPNQDSRGNGSCLSSLSKSYPDTSSSQISPFSDVSSFDINRRWHCVYTVCMDHNSPEVQNLKDGQIPLLSLNLLREPPKVQCDNKCSSGSGGCVAEDGEGATLNKLGCTDNVGFLGENDDHFFMQNANPHESINFNAGEMISEDSDLFKEYFGSLSTIDKVERVKTSSRRRYSSQYVVRRDFTPLKKLRGETLNCVATSVNHVALEDPAIQSSEEWRSLDSCKQDQKFNKHLLGPGHAVSGTESVECPAVENPSNNNLIEAMDNRESSNRENGLQEKITACLEALQNLEIVSENAVQVFAELERVVPREELSTGPRALLCKEASQVLTRIAQKLNCVAEMMPLGNKD